MPRPIASLSMDLDNKWSYLKTQGDPGWESAPSYLEKVVDRYQALLDRYGLKMTVFVVGRDAEDPQNAAAFEKLAACGHEFGNHSFWHEPWLHEYSSEELKAELDRAESAIRQATGQAPEGFRGPGFSCCPALLRELYERGYRYDCSTFPTFLGPLARLYMFMRSGLGKKEREQRKGVFGSVRDGFRSLHPWNWEFSDGQLLEIPVTTMPLFRVPIHASYVLFLARWSEWLADTYFTNAMRLCRLFRVEPSILLHPLDILGCDDEPDMGFFPAMDLVSAKKVRVVERMLAAMTRRFAVVSMGEHARAVAARSTPSKKIALA